MFWDRDRLLLALSTKKLQLSNKPQSHAGLLYKSYAETYGLEFVSEGLAREQSIRVVPSSEFDLVVQTFEPAQDSITEDREPVQALIVHGYFDHSGLYHHLIRHLLQHGCAWLRLTCQDMDCQVVRGPLLVVSRSIKQRLRVW